MSGDGAIIDVLALSMPILADTGAYVACMKRRRIASESCIRSVVTSGHTMA